MFSVFFSTFVACLSCDDGRIYEKEVALPQEGLTLKLTGHLTGVDSWPDKYTLCLAGFTDESEFAVLSKVIASDNAADGEVEVVLSGIKEDLPGLGGASVEGEGGDEATQPHRPDGCQEKVCAAHVAQ